jgi:hypothetical protein
MLWSCGWCLQLHQYLLKLIVVMFELIDTHELFVRWRQECEPPIIYLARPGGRRGLLHYFSICPLLEGVIIYVITDNMSLAE